MYTTGQAVIPGIPVVLDAEKTACACSTTLFTFQIYLYYRTEYSIENEVSAGNDQVATVQQYLTELKLYNGNDEETVAAQMQQDGFRQIPGDLTKMSETTASGYTCLGYKSSTALKDAITDIRVLPKDAEKPETLKNYARIGTTDAGDSIYTSTNINCGQPILAEFNAIGNYGNRKLSYRAI